MLKKYMANRSEQNILNVQPVLKYNNKKIHIYLTAAYIVNKIIVYS